MMIKYDEKTETWVEAKEPFMTIDIETEEDYDRLNEALDAYYDNTAYITEGNCCSECGACIPTCSYDGGVKSDSVQYCYRCGRRFVEDDE